MTRLSSVSTPLIAIDFGAIERNKEKIRREPFDDLAKRLDQLIDSSIKASEFMIETNRIQTEIVTEIKTGGDATDRHAKNNIKLTVVVVVIIVLSVFGLLYTVLSNSSGVSFSEKQQAVFNGYRSEMSDALAMVNKQAVINNSESKESLKEILHSLTQLNKNITDSDTILKDNSRELEQLKLDNAQHKLDNAQYILDSVKHKNEIYIMSKKILKIENKQKNAPSKVVSTAPRSFIEHLKTITYF